MHVADLAAKVRPRCSTRYLRNIETAGDQPSIELAYRLARALSEALGRPVTLDDFSTEVTEAGAA